MCYKLLERIILHRISPSVDEILNIEEAEFRPGRSTQDHVPALTTYVENGADSLQLVHMLTFVAVIVSIAGEVDFVHLDWRVECDCCRLQPMRHKIGMLLLSFSMCTHDTAGNIIRHNLSGVDNDDFVAILVKLVTCLLMPVP